MIVYECEIDVYLSLNQSQRQAAMQALNKHHYGSKTIPLNISSSSLPQELLDATSNVGRTLVRKLKVRVHDDGRLELV